MHHFPAAHDGERRDGADAEGTGGGRVGVDVDLDELGALAEFGGDLVDNRRHLTARAAPFRPEVDDDGHVRLQNLRVEGGIGDGKSVGHGFSFGKVSWIRR